MKGTREISSVIISKIIFNNGAVYIYAIKANIGIINKVTIIFFF